MQSFTIGGVVRQTFDLVGRHLGFLVALSVLLVGIPKLVGVVLIVAAASSAAQSPWLAVWGAVPGLLGYIGGMVLQVAAMRTAVFSASSRPVTFGETLAASLGLFLPVLAISILSGIATACAAILLVFPAIMLACRWIVAIPSEVAERPGIMASLGRSAALTKGYRWQIFALMIVFFVISATAGGVGQLVARIVVTPSSGVNWLAVVIDALVTALVGPIGAVGAAAIYLNLRAAKEGMLSQDLVSAFD